MKKYVDKDKLQEFATKMNEKQKTIFRSMYGSPLVASTAADMTDTDRIYVYVGSETGYTNGNWYYYDGTAWTSGGVYNSTALVTDTTLAISGMAADSKAVGDEFSDVNVRFDNVVNSYTSLEPYFFKANTYINSDGEEVSLNGYNLYKIPYDSLDILHVKWDGSYPFFNTLAIANVFRILLSDETYLIPSLGAGNSSAFVPVSAASGEAMFIGGGAQRYVVVCSKADRTQYVRIYKNKLYPDLNQPVISGVVKLDSTNSIQSRYYLNPNNAFNVFSGNYYVLFKRMSSGDRIGISGTISGVSFLGVFRDASANVTAIETTDTSFTAPTDGFVCLFINTNETKAYTYYPNDSIKIEWKNVVDFTGESQFNGLSAVAFGTSLTYRAQTTGGYLQYLPTLSGMTFDNQGIGSSVILGNLLTAVKNYASYSDKTVCILEGFVNDWYQDKPLGTFDDNTETTVCGCVRSALNYILSQNANITVFLVLDHYGRLLSGVDCSTTAVNGSGLTQYEYYEEIAKVSESLGIPVIKEYAISQISENTPQYLLDNIHCNDLGARQSAYAIWSKMKTHFPNQL